MKHTPCTFLWSLTFAGFFITSNILIILLPCSESARILSLSLFASKSHKNSYEPLLVALAAQGHEVTIVNPIAPSSPRSPKLAGRIRDIVGIPNEDILNSASGNVFEADWSGQGSQYIKMYNYMYFLQRIQANCPKFFSLPVIHQLLQEEFDLIIMNPVLNECLLGMAHAYKVPVIFVTTLQAPHWIISGTVGGPIVSPILPLFFSETKDTMNFKERVDTFICHVGLSLFHEYYYYPWVERMYREQFGQHVPSVNEIMKNTSLILSNSHFSLNFPRITMPNDIEVGGMHCTEAKALPKDLAEFLSDTNEHGFIYFSFGSLIKLHEMPKYYRDIFLHTFAQFPQKILWKWEANISSFDIPPALSNKIMLSPWIPQQSVLGHKNIRLFITHGGLLSTEEAVFHAVPLLGFPMYGDQQINMQWAEKMGFGLRLYFKSLTDEILKGAIGRILNEARFKEKAAEYSSIFRGRPQSALELGLYWVEYVLRHNGAQHLKSTAATEMNFFAYHSLDVITFLAVVLVLTVFLLYKLSKVVYRIVLNSVKILLKVPKKSKVQ